MFPGILLLAVLLIPAPVLVGSLFGKVNNSLIFRWVCGQVCLWAGFLVISVPVILAEPEGSFRMVCIGNAVLTVALALAGLTVCLRERKNKAGQEKSRRMMTGTTVLIWASVLAGLVAQLVLTAVLAYEEGDDAFYVAVSTVTQESGTMYQVLPYTGGSTGLDARHGLAPFPIWIAMLAKLSGIHSAIVAQVMAPMVLIAMAYGIFYLFGRELFEKDLKKTGLFLLLVELLVVFGGQSLYTAENFLLVRTAQGKAVLAAIVIPFLFFLVYLLLQKLQKGEKGTAVSWILVGLAMAAACLCSTQGALLTCVLLGVAVICMMFAYRRWAVCIPGACCMVLPVGMAVLYLLLG